MMFLEQSVWIEASVDIGCFKLLEQYTDTSFARTVKGAQIIFLNSRVNCNHLFA